MGGSSSKEEPSELQISAARKFHERIRGYNYAMHGPYYEYVEWCRAKYQYDCIPVYARVGSNYNPHNNYRGYE